MVLGLVVKYQKLTVLCIFNDPLMTGDGWAKRFSMLEDFQIYFSNVEILISPKFETEL